MNGSKKSATIIVAVVMLGVGLLAGGGISAAVANTNKSNDATMMPVASASDNSDGVTVGGAKMVKTKDIVDNAVKANNVTTLVSLVKLAGLVDTLKSEGPFTVFAPNNDAFAKLPAATVKSLQEPANKAALANILTYHVVSGTYTTAALKVMAEKGQTLTSVQGEMLTPVMEDNMLKIEDASGNKVTIQTADVISSNGVTHVIESVLMPKA
jgi:uncharacterized surface protein with fasciclin (FAS1) repeats